MASRDYFSSSRQQDNYPRAPRFFRQYSQDERPLPSPCTPDSQIDGPTLFQDGNATPYSSGQDRMPANGTSRDPFNDDAAIQMRRPRRSEDTSRTVQAPYVSQAVYMHEQTAPQDLPRHGRGRGRKREPIFSFKRPWFIYIVTTIQIIIFVVQLIRNAVLTGSPIEIHPSFNPMIGPSPYVLINMGARYVPCMRNQEGVQNSNTTLLWPCSNQTSETPTCTLSQLCGFSGVPDPVVGGSLNAKPAPNQWFRFIVPIFLHAGIVHIGFNMLLQLLLGGDMERIVGPMRLALVYFSSGIFGFVMGGDFAASGIASCGASGSIFGIIALCLLDLLYTWQRRPTPWKDLAIIIVDVAVSFVLGLLPGLDNFSHIGGFLMGLVLGICVLRSPLWLRKHTEYTDNAPQPTLTGSQALFSGGLFHDGTGDESTTNLVARDTRPIAVKSPAVRLSELSSPMDLEPSLNDGRQYPGPPSITAALANPAKAFSDRKPLWWLWMLLRTGALVGAIVAFVALIRSFYTHHNTQCPGCKYLSCLPVSNWCEIGDLTFTDVNTTSSSRLRL